MSETQKTPTQNNNPRGHETSDASISAVIKFGIGLTVVIAVMMLLMFWMKSVLQEQEQRSETPPSPLAVGRQLPAAPRLQVTPEMDLQKYLAREDSILHSYGWVVREAGIVHIPIDRAIELVAQKGLPVTTGQREMKSKNGGSPQ
ncbi:MAG: hypothetical protein ONB44_01500 [candidate division KSB1 bacterium]|nr:hypothetical protein [candidate division KSB1 bacterium]MDZ7300795.1 hypothetical protein [candidate division KSB1 bacterium]MDZ7309934.1 hypothetical protein [candidate division KSB1 bacterium]